MNPRGGPTVGCVLYANRGVVCEDSIVFVKQSGFGDFFEEGRVFENGIVEGYVGRGRGGGDGGAGGCVGLGHGGGQGGLDGAFGAGVRCGVYVEGAGVAGVEARGKIEGRFDKGCRDVWGIYDADDE